MYELRVQTDYFVGHEAISYAGLRPDCFILGTRACGANYDGAPMVRAGTSAEWVALNMGFNYTLWHKYEGDTSRLRQGEPGTVSVVNMAQVPQVQTSATDLARLLRANMTNLAGTLDNVRRNTQHYEENGDGLISEADRLVDLAHFAQVLRSSVTATDIQGAAMQLEQAVDGAVIYNEHWNNDDWNHDNSHGISIAFPGADSRSCYYSGLWLDFAAGAEWGCRTSINAGTDSAAPEVNLEWGPMLADFVGTLNPSAPEDPGVPALVAQIVEIRPVYLPLVLRSYMPGTASSPTPTSP